MAEDEKNNFDGSPSHREKTAEKKRSDYAVRSKMPERDENEGADTGFSWSAVAHRDSAANAAALGPDNFMSNRIEFGGKNLENGKFANENFENANFSVANLKGVDSNAVLKHTNFSGAVLNGVVLTDADLDNAILLDITIDAIALEDLQELVEYLAKYAPHKLNLAKMNLTMLNLAKIDLKNLNLRGVDFTGCDFTGVNIMELDLSECIITPQQIAQALGRVPNAEELRRIMAPKVKPKGPKSQGIDLTDLFFDNGKEAGVWETAKDKGISTAKIVDMIKAGHKVYRRVVKRPEGNRFEAAAKESAERKEAQVSNSNEELKKVLEENKRALIEKHKREELEARRNKKMELEQALARENEQEKTPEKTEQPKIRPLTAERIASFRDRSRD